MLSRFDDRDFQSSWHLRLGATNFSCASYIALAMLLFPTIHATLPTPIDLVEFADVIYRL